MGKSKPQGDEAPNSELRTEHKLKELWSLSCALKRKKKPYIYFLLKKKTKNTPPLWKPNACLRVHGVILNSWSSFIVWKKAGSIAWVSKQLLEEPEAKLQPGAHQLPLPRSSKDLGCVAVDTWHTDRDGFVREMSWHISNEHSPNQHRFQSLLVWNKGDPEQHLVPVPFIPGMTLGSAPARVHLFHNSNNG